MVSANIRVVAVAISVATSALLLQGCGDDDECEKCYKKCFEGLKSNETCKVVKPSECTCNEDTDKCKDTTTAGMALTKALKAKLTDPAPTAEDIATCTAKLASMKASGAGAEDDDNDKDDQSTAAAANETTCTTCYSDCLFAQAASPTAECAAATTCPDCADTKEGGPCQGLTVEVRTSALAATEQNTTVTGAWVTTENEGATAALLTACRDALKPATSRRLEEF